MNDNDIVQVPSVLEAIHQDTRRAGFTMASELHRRATSDTCGNQTRRSFFRTWDWYGCRHGLALSGIDAQSRLESVENDPTVLEIARRHLGHDPRVTFHLMDGAAFLAESQFRFDLIYADTWPGKFTHLDLALSLLRIGGIYLVDDLLPQPSWPDGHAPKVPALITELESRMGFVSTKLAWASGLMVLVKTNGK